MAGRKPIGKRAMTAAQRQAKYRKEKRAEFRKLKAKVRRADRRSRPQRWADAVAELQDLQQEYQAWLDNLPENFQATPLADALEAVCGLDLEEIAMVELPRGFGQD